MGELALKRNDDGKMRHKVDNEIVIDYLKPMKMENHPNFNFLFVGVKLNHSFCFGVCLRQSD